MKILLKPDYKESEVMRFEYFKTDIEKNLAPNVKYNLLDVGCSQLDLHAVSTQVSVYGIDYKPTNAYDSMHFKLCDLNNSGIPFEDEMFDFVIAGEILEHVKRPFEFIEELSRVLKKDGILYLSTPNPYFYLEILKELFGINVLDEAEHLNLFSRVHLLSYCKKQNLQLIELKRFKFWIPYIRLMILSLHTPRLLNYQNIYKFKKIVTKIE